MTDYFSELEDQLGRATERGIHSRRGLRAPLPNHVIAGAASMLLVVAVVAVALGIGSARHGLSRPEGHSERQNSANGSPRAVSPNRTALPPINPHSRAPVKILAKLSLRPPSGAGRPSAVTRVIQQGSVRGITIAGTGLPPSTNRDTYAVWLTDGPHQSKLLGFVNPGVKNDGRLKAAGILPKDAFRYHELLLTRETHPDPKAPGSVVIEGRFHR